MSIMNGKQLAKLQLERIRVVSFVLIMFNTDIWYHTCLIDLTAFQKRNSAIKVTFLSLIVTT